MTVTRHRAPCRFAAEARLAAGKRASSVGQWGAWGSPPRHRDGSRVLFQRPPEHASGHLGFAVCLIERNERPAPLAGDVEAPTFCHASYIFHMDHAPNFPHGSCSEVDHPDRKRDARTFRRRPPPATRSPPHLLYLGQRWNDSSIARRPPSKSFFQQHRPAKRYQSPQPGTFLYPLPYAGLSLVHAPREPAPKDHKFPTGSERRGVTRAQMPDRDVLPLLAMQRTSAPLAGRTPPSFPSRRL